MISFVERLKTAEDELAVAQVLVESKNQACREILRLLAEGIACGDETTGDPFTDTYIVNQKRRPTEKELGVRSFLEPLLTCRAGDLVLLRCKTINTYQTTSDHNGPTRSFEMDYTALGVLTGRTPFLVERGEISVPVSKWAHVVDGKEQDLVICTGHPIILLGKWGLHLQDEFAFSSHHMYTWSEAFLSLMGHHGFTTTDLTLEIHTPESLKQHVEKNGKLSNPLGAMIRSLDPDGSNARQKAFESAAL